MPQHHRRWSSRDPESNRTSHPPVLHEVPTGTPALDWQVPLEWNVRVARIETLDGTVVVDFADCNLHVVSYKHAGRRHRISR